MQNPNTDQKKFSLVTDAIKKYYEDGDLELKKLINENIVNPDNFKSRWQTFDSNVEQILRIKPVGSTTLQPSFSSYIEIQKENFGELTRIKRLHYFVSLLGPFYSIIGDDISQITVEGEGTLFIINFLTVSPEREYEKIFKGLESEIESQFIGYYFVPFSILQLPVSIPIGSVEKPYFEALFAPGFDLTRWTLGDKNYKDEGWISEGRGYTAYPGKIVKFLSDQNSDQHT